MISGTIFVIIFTGITALATSFRAYNSRKDVGMRLQELRIKKAALRLELYRAKKKYGDNDSYMLKEIEDLLK